MKNYWLDFKKNEEIKKIRLEMSNIFRAFTLPHPVGSIAVDKAYIEKLIKRLEELEGK